MTGSSVGLLRVRKLGYCPDYATGHAHGQDLVLLACANLLGRTFAAQVPLSGFAKRNLTCTGNLESLGDAFVRLLHVVLGKRVCL
jgi:hypothetical protein